MKHDGGQDVIFRIMDATGFDELCSIRGLLGHVIVRLDGNWNQFTGWPKMLDLPATGHYLRQQEEALSRYFSMLMTKKKTLVSFSHAVSFNPACILCPALDVCLGLRLKEEIACTLLRMVG